MIRDGSSLTSGKKYVIGASVGYVVAGDTVIAASKGSLGGIGLCKSTQV